VARLAVYRDQKLLREITLGEAPMRIGRAPENEIVLEDANKGVSRTHAEIRHEEGRYVILDLNSQNGVWIRERRVKVEPLPVDEPVTVGPYRLVLLAAAAAPSSSTSIPGTIVAPAPRAAEATARVEAAAHAQPVAKADAPVPPKPTPAPTPAPASVSRAPKPAAAKSTSGGSNRTLLYGGVAVAVLAAIGVFAMLSGGGTTPQPETPPVAEAPPSVAPPTSSVPPPQPTDEDRFREHFDKAQGFITAGDKTNAAAENTAALAILPNDERGLKQRLEIEAIGAPPPPPPGPDVAAKTPKKEPPAPSSMTVAPRANESASERASREKNARYLLDDGKKAFDERRFADAIDMLQRAIDQSGRDDFGSTPGEAASVLKLARTAKANADAAAARANAQKLFEGAKALAATDIVGAFRRLREAQALDQKIAGAAELMASLQEQAAAQGEAALTSAKNFDRFKRIPDAIREYDRAVQLLELVPGGHKDLALAKQRSAELKGR
jgi:predicted component of type VI protein secretion system